MASSSEHHYPLSGGYDAVCLYAAPLDSGWSSVEQALLPDFGVVYHAYSYEAPMKGVWSGEKSIGTTHRPAVDSLFAVNAELLRNFIAAVASSGAAVSVSITRDASAVVLTVLNGNEKHKLYPSDLQELTEALQDGVDSFTSAPSTPPKQGTKR